MDTCLLSLSDKYLQDSVVSEYKKGQLFMYLYVSYCRWIQF